MGYNSKRLHILLVDDHHDTVRALDRLLTMEGHCVTPAESCDEAIAAARALRFDVLLSDIGMPEKDGFALLKELRALYPVPAVAITGYGRRHEVHQMIEAGFDAHVLKPVEAARLRAVLNTVTTRPSSS
jgi:CheY-like chemotaxis protein